MIVGSAPGYAQEALAAFEEFEASVLPALEPRTFGAGAGRVCGGMCCFTRRVLRMKIGATQREKDPRSDPLSRHHAVTTPCMRIGHRVLCAESGGGRGMW